MPERVDPNHWSNWTDEPPMSSDQFHQRGHHVQHAHGRRAAKLASDGSHTSGAMIALLPTAKDAKRLALKGGEKVEDLHLTLRYLGAGDAFGHEDRNNIISAVRSYMSEVPGPVTAKIFGVAHWNGGGDEPSWVWSVGDNPETDVPLDLLHTATDMALESLHDHPDLPVPHTPWAAHICAAYTDDLSLLRVLEDRLGPVTFDRVRVVFAGDATDIDLGSAVTASAVLRRKVRDFEAGVDFEIFQSQWEKAVDTTAARLEEIMDKWRSSIRSQVTTALEDDQPDRLASISVNTLDARVLVEKQMIELATLAGGQAQKEAEDQGIEIPEWDLSALTAALAGRSLLKSVARMTADALSGSVITSAKRAVTQLLGLSRSPTQIADEVDDRLTELGDTGPKAILGTAMTTAQNTGRRAVFDVAPKATYYASEILDKNTCTECRRVDGEEYGSLEIAIKAYPVSGYKDCIGSRYGNNCRGMIIARWPEAETASGTIATTEEVITMPWHVSKSSECGSSEPWAVIKDSDGSVEGCHATKAQAEDQMAALYASEGKTTTVAETMGGKPNKGTKKDKRLRENDYAEMECPDGKMAGPDGECVDMAAGSESLAEKIEVPKTLEQAVEEALAAKRGMAVETAEGMGPAWRGPICVEGQVTGDGREFAPEALTWQEPPIPLRWNKEDSHGGETHTVAVNVGKITKIWRENGMIMGEGELDLATEDGRTVHGKIKGEYLKGISIDADSITDADVEYVFPEDVNMGEDEADDILAQLFAQPEKIVFHGGRIRAATLCDIPAFAEAYIALLDEEGAVVAGGQTHPELVPERVRPARQIDGLIAAGSGGPRDENWLPPVEWFRDPKLSVPTTIQVTDDGRVYGHAAQWGSCHIGQTDVCVQPPNEDQHSYFMTGETSTREGKRVSVGQITVGTGHAPLSYGAVPATEHYDNTGSVVADVAVGNDQHGIWVAGSIRPGATPARIHELRASGAVSGDWRRIGNKLRLVGLLAVNVPGFSIPNMRARVASGIPEALVAAGRPTTVHAITQRERVQEAFKIVMDRLFESVHEGR